MSGLVPLLQIRSDAVGVDSANLKILNFCGDYTFLTRVLPLVGTAPVHPIPKTSTVEQLSDLRLINLLPVLGKIFEILNYVMTLRFMSVITNRLLNNLLSDLFSFFMESMII